jgi:hypothetical protein
MKSENLELSCNPVSTKTHRIDGLGMYHAIMFRQTARQMVLVFVNPLWANQNPIFVIVLIENMCFLLIVVYHIFTWEIAYRHFKRDQKDWLGKVLPTLHLINCLVHIEKLPNQQSRTSGQTLCLVSCCKLHMCTSLDSPLPNPSHNHRDIVYILRHHSGARQGMPVLLLQHTLYEHVKVITPLH